MSRQVVIKPLEQIDATRIILYARKRLDKSDRSTSDQAFGFGYYRQMALLEPRISKGICCHRCRGMRAIGEPFAKKNQGAWTYRDLRIKEFAHNYAKSYMPWNGSSL